MKSPNKKPSRKRATPSKPHTAATASAQTQTTAASTPQTPHSTKRKLRGSVYGLTSDGFLNGILKTLRAEYQSHRDAIAIRCVLEHYHHVSLFADHVQVRAAIATLRHSLVDFDRFHSDTVGTAWSKLPPGNQVHCYGGHATEGEDEEARFEFLPQRDLLRLIARFSDGEKLYMAYVFLTRTEAEALLHDLQRALADMERFGDV